MWRPDGPARASGWIAVCGSGMAGQEATCSERSLLGFSPTLPAGSKITSAQLRLYLAGVATGDAPLTIQAYRVRSDWAETITWQEHLGLTVDSTPAASASVPATLGWYAWDVTGALQAWSDHAEVAGVALIRPGLQRPGHIPYVPAQRGRHTGAGGGRVVDGQPEMLLPRDGLSPIAAHPIGLNRQRRVAGCHPGQV